MKAFLDTSSLIKLYHQEEGSAFVIETLSSSIEEIYLSEISALEFRSALWKKIREKEIQEKAAIEVIKCFHNDSDNFRWILLQSDIVESAGHMLMKYGDKGLRTLDSIQLASALTLKKSGDCVFLSADKLLLSLFEKEKLPIL
ncbi:MAG: PIN domain-containing protein [Nitrospirae bacterium]|nr:MAG: PIN domain-containing protein [Nitrospirota bacterium]